jgi:hypothetical protein
MPQSKLVRDRIVDILESVTAVIRIGVYAYIPRVNVPVDK